jgi:hypothetical protein
LSVNTVASPDWGTSEALSGDNSFLTAAEVGPATLPLRFAGAGFGFAVPRTATTALFTNFAMANLADTDEPSMINPRIIAAIVITRNFHVCVWEIVFDEIEAKTGFMTELLMG